jgi:hypothetical protein
MRKLMSRFTLRSALVLAALALPAVPSFAQQAARAGASGAVSGAKEFFVHTFHKEKLGGELECNMCHVAVKEGSVTLKRPGHDQCMTCHSDDFNKELKQAVCAQCHSSFPPTGAEDLVPFPRFKGTRAVLFEFSHAKHVDQKARVDAKTGFRSDCTFCHKFDKKGVFATFPAHEECAACHSKAGMKPQLTAELTASGCRGCHTPEEIENPGFTEARRFTGQRQISNGKYVDIAFSHLPHFKSREQFDLNCTTCHYEIPKSTSIANLSLPKMLDCVQCHDSARAVKAEFRMSNCKSCHSDTVTASVIPTSHTKNVKPDFHTEAFRRNHESEAAAANAKCSVCHLNVTPSVAAKVQCDSCHQAMRPVSHTARWKDDLHGKYAALDRTECAVCHTAAYCSDCHNELPRSHQPLPLFKAGAHAIPAQLDMRSCLTCHTFQNTCSECHLNKVVQNAAPRQKALMAKASTVDIVNLFR